MKRSSAILKSLVVLGILAFGLAASGSVIISRPGPRPLPPRLPIIPTPGTNRPPIIFTNLPPIFITNRPPIRITNLPPILPPTPITHCTPAPADLVGWWKGEGNALDSVLGNNGVAQNITYASGEVGQAFVFDGTSSSIRVPASSNLDVGLGSGFTLEAWVNPSLLTIDGWLPLHIFEWNTGSGSGDAPVGVQMGIGGNSESGNLYANLEDTTTAHHVIISANGIMTTNGFQHVALTYDKTTGVAVLYRNGVVVATNNLGIFAPQTSFDLYLGVRPAGSFAPFYFAGLLDEPGVYNRALSAAEMQAIYNAGSAGKCPIAVPACVSPPSGLVGWWQAESNANDVVGGNNGTLEGGATFAPGMAGQGFRLDGTNSYVQIPDAAALKPANVTVEAWVWLDPDITTPRLEYIIFKRNSWTYLFEGYSLLKESLPNGDGTYTDRFSFVVTSGGDQVITYSTTAVQRGVWYHVAGTYDGNELTLWVNGAAEASAIAGFALDYGTRPVFIGTSGEPEPYNGKLAGIIDEASIYNRALSSNEIASIYSADSAGKCTPACAPAPSGLVSWWPAEENANDIVGGNNGMVQNITYANGEVGQAFNFDGVDDGISVPASSSLNVGAGQGMTLECWIAPTSVAGEEPLMEWSGNGGSIHNGVHFWLSVTYAGVGGPGCIYANIVDSMGGLHIFASPAGIVQAGILQHVALTYDKVSGVGKIYYNGSLVASNNLGSFTPKTDTALLLGRRMDFGDLYYQGVIDESAIFNRALSSNEIAAIYNAGSAGKCAPACTPAPSGLVSWWPAKENANDIVGTNNGTPQNITYTAGEVGQAFVFDGSSSLIMVPASSSLDVGLGSGFTIETWVNPAGATLNNLQSLMEWNVGSGSGGETIGAQFGFSGGWNADLYANIMDTTLTGHYLNSAGGIMTGDSFQHVALTFDKTTGLAVLYRNGVVVQSANLGTGFTPWTSNNFYIGCRPAGPFANYFHGIIDEPSIYNRALSPDEIAAIYNAGSAGKCAGPLPPGITVQPVHQTTVQGSNVVLSVDVVGTGPFSYQWSFNGTNISGATNATLTLTNLHPYQSGCYAVTTTTPYGSITSSCATVTVIARNILVYKYFGTGRFTTAGQAFTYVYSGQMFFIPDSTNGTFVGWGTIKGNKQYWVNPLSDYLLITIPGASNQTFTVLGQAGQEIDTNGYPHIWSYLHKGKNTPLTIGKNKYFSFPNTFTADATHVYPDSQTGNMVLSESSSIYTFVPQSTQTANNTGQTMTDLVNALTNSLDSQGYQKQ